MSFVPPPPQSLFGGHPYGGASYAPPRDVPTGPPVTVFVGNITERAQDAMIRHLLTTCGPVLSWKRVQGATGKPQAFGFCEYGNPDAGLRSIRILHDWVIGDKALVVKVDAKTSELLDEYKVQRARRVFGKKDSISLDKPEEYMDEGMYAEDALAKERISAILHDHAKEMNAFVPKSSSGDKSDNENRPKIINQTGPKESLADVEMEDGKRDIIHREIDKFRETMKIREAEKEEEKKKREEESSKSSQNGSSSRRHSPPRRRTRDRSSGRRSARPSSVTRSRSRSYSPRRRESRSSRRSRRASRSRSRSRSRRRDRSTPPRKSQVELWKEREMEEETKERKKAERKAREKEANYQERLRKWENRESKMAKEFEKEKMREVKRLEEIDREAKRLKEFLEDYDDERDDEKYYRGRELDRRLLEREREAAKDGEDRSREKEEIEDLKNQIVEEGYKGHDQSMELQRRMEERERRHNNGGPAFVPPIVHIDDEPVIIPAPPDQQAVDNIAVEGGMSPPDPSSPPPIYKLDDDNNSAPPPQQHDINSPPVAAVPHNIVPAIHIPVQPSQTFTPVPLSKPSLMPSEVIAPSEPGQKKKLDVRDVFNQDDDDHVASGQKKGRKSLPPISKQEDTPSGGRTSSSEDKRKHIKSLIEKIPTDRSALFAYKVDWDMVDNQLMEKRIRPWVNKKIAEYIGEPEPTLTDFICSKVLAGSTPKAVLEDVQMVLDEEAEVFVVKMWRLLIYEIENKKYKASAGTTTTTTTTAAANTGSSSGGGVER